MGRAEGAALDPIDHIVRVGFEKEFELGAEACGTLFKAGSFFHFLEPIHLGLEHAERGANGEIKFAGSFEKLLAVGEGMAAVGSVRQACKKETRAVAELLRERGNAARGIFAAKEHVDVASELFKTDVRDGEAEVAGGHFFQLVGFIEK